MAGNAARPALRGESHCYFHNHIQAPALDAESADPYLPFIEDATSLQFALMRVMRLLQNPYCTEYKRWALLLYSLQIACSNLKNFMAEQPKAEADEGEQPQPKIASAEKEKKVSSKGGEEPSLAGLLLGLLANGPNGDPDAPPPRIRNREDYEADVKQHRPPGAALPGETAAAG